MSGLRGPIPFSQWRMLWQNELHAPDSESAAWLRERAEFFQLAITERRLVHRIARIPPVKSVRAVFTLNLTPSHTQQGMEYLSRELNSLRRTVPAIHARVCSLTQELRPWCLLESIETTLDFGY